MRLPLILLLAALVGCSDDQKPAGGNPVPPPPGENPQPPKSTPLPDVKLDELQSSAENTALVPSPAEMQHAMEKAGITKALSSAVPDRKMKMDATNTEVVCVRTGVALADLVLTVKDAPKEKLVERLELVKGGMKTLGGGADIQATIDDLETRIKNDSVSRDDLVKEFDELHGALVPELKYEAGDKVVPLIQAGSWLEGSNLVAQAVVEANKPEAGSTLLRQPAVVDYFAKYVKVAGDGHPPEIVTQLDNTLKKLKEIASKPALTLDDVKEVKAQTDQVLGLI